MSLFNVIPVTTDDYRRSAKRRVPQFLFDYADGGANAERTLALNTSAFAGYRLRQRVMRDVSAVDISTTLLGRDVAMPVALSPVGMAGMYRRRGEAQATRAAARINVPFTLSTNAICSIEEVNSACSQPAWFQLYMLRDRDFVLDMLKRAWDAGSHTLVFTVDLPVPGLRLRDFRNGMLGGGLIGGVSRLGQLLSSPLWLWDVGIKGKPHNFGNLADRVKDPNDLEQYKHFVESQFDPAVTWDDIRWLRDNWAGKLLIKGVMEPDDAMAAVDCGAEGVVVSNHGGRQLDGVHGTLNKLPDVIAAVGERTEVYIDSGIRDGIDALIAVALGVRGVMIGRPWVYALASRGESGVYDLLNVFRQEMTAGMALTGVRCIEDLNRDVLECVS